MLKLCFLLFITTILLKFHLICAKCCPMSTKIWFGTRGKNCIEFGASNTITRGISGRIWIDRKVCRISLCDDGRPLTSGLYCGKGSCNIIGCNCDDGCREGLNGFKNLELFKVINENYVEWVEY